jgi:protease PrsW
MIEQQKTDVLALLRSSPLFGSVPETELLRIAPRLTLERFAHGDTVIREGEDGDRAYLVASGEAAVVTRDLIGEEVSLKVFGPGEGFGETALVEAVKRTATVKAATDLDVYVLDRATFEDLGRSAPTFARSVREYVDLLAVDRVLKKASPFARLSPERIRKIAGQLVPVRAAAGEDIVREGEEGDRFYLIRRGQFEVLQGTRRVAELGPGDVFGEIALLTGGKRIATVRALGDGELLALAKPEFLAVVNEDTSVQAQMFELGKLRFRATTGQALTTPDPVTSLMPYLDEKHRGRYWKLLIGGAALFALASLITIQSAQPLAIMAALVLGAFLVPIVYVVYLVESDILATRPGAVIATFGLAALLGIPVSGILQVVMGLDPEHASGALGIAVMEEVLKLLGVVWLLGRSSARFRMDGVVFGAAAGMGFAAFETVLFGLAFIDEAGVLLQTLGLRSLLAPLGHGTWTAIVCATIWGERSRGRLISAPVIGALGMAIALHAIWDWQPIGALFPAYALAANLVWFLAIGAAGILVLRALVHHATTEELTSIVALNPELTRKRASDAPRLECHRCGQVAPSGAHYCVRCGSALRARSARTGTADRSARAPVAT